MKFDGPLFTAPGGRVLMAVGGQFRTESYDRTTLSAGAETVRLDRRAGAVFGELYVPLIGDENGRPGVRALAVTLAGRWETFSDFGDAKNPKIGVLYAPAPSVKLRGSYSTSFQAPGFYDLGRPQSVQPLPGGFFTPAAPGAALPDVIVLADGVQTDTESYLAFLGAKCAG